MKVAQVSRVSIPVSLFFLVSASNSAAAPVDGGSLGVRAALKKSSLMRARISCEGSLVNGVFDLNLPSTRFTLSYGGDRFSPLRVPHDLGALGKTSFRVELSDEGPVPVLEIEAVTPSGINIAGSPLDHFPMTVAYRSTTASGDDLLVECQVGRSG